jgi:Zn-dependent metalloprotease
MTQCRFCKSDIPSDATRCPHCTSFLDGEQPQGSPGQVTYIVDKDLVRFVKVAGFILAIFLTVALSFYGLDLKQLGKEIKDTSKEIEDTHFESQKLDLSIKQAQLDLDRETKEIEKEVQSAKKAATDASETSASIHKYLKESEESKNYIIEYRRTILALQPGSKQAFGSQVSQTESNPTQLEQLVGAKLLETMRNVLPPKQYSALRSQIGAEKKGGLRRQVFDAKNTDNLPGDLVRSESFAPISDQAVNEVYDNLEIIYRFFKDVLGLEIPDNKGKTLVVTIHYSTNYNNGFWNGQQIVLGDGDGKIFRKGGFSSLSVMAHEVGIAVNQFTAQLAYEGQSGALAQSFGDIMSCLVEQWQKRQTSDEASWLVGANMFAPGFNGVALRSLKAPGTAYHDTAIGTDESISTMEKYYSGADDNGGVHKNNGIPNKAFFELAKKLKGYAWEKPGRIWFESYRTLKPRSTFQDLANATLRFAKKTYGERSVESEAVIASWASVGIIVEPGKPGQGP